MGLFGGGNSSTNRSETNAGSTTGVDGSNNYTGGSTPISINVSGKKNRGANVNVVSTDYGAISSANAALTQGLDQLSASYDTLFGSAQEIFGGALGVVGSLFDFVGSSQERSAAQNAGALAHVSALAKRAQSSGGENAQRDLIRGAVAIAGVAGVAIAIRSFRK